LWMILSLKFWTISTQKQYVYIYYGYYGQ
jgi:hypothetical protein